MSNINFFLKDKKKDQTSIEAIIRFKGERYKLSTGISIETKYWNSDSHKCKLLREYENAAYINNRLNKLEVKLKSLFNGYEINNIIPSPERIKNDLNSQKKETITLVDVFKVFNAKKDYASETQKKYITTLHWIEAYQKKYKVTLLVSDIDLKWYERFKSYFFSVKRKVVTKYGTSERFYSLNYFGSIIKCLKVVLKDAGKEFSITEDVKDRNFKTDSEESDSIYLNESELKLIIDFVPSFENINMFTKETRIHNLARSIEMLNNVKQRFLIGCYTALRVSDFKRMDLVNVKDGFIRIKPKKGRKLNSDVVIPIHPVVRSIIDSGFDFERKIYEQKINNHIKEICRVIGIDEQVSITRTEGGRQVERVYPKWQLVTTHTARRSGATNMFKAGIPSISIMKITGHRTEKSFLKYIKISAEENAELLSNHPFFSKT